MKIIEKGKRIAAHLLEASADDITFAGGVFSIAGTDRGVTLPEVARVAHIPTSYPSELELGLQDSAAYDPPALPGVMEHTPVRSISIATPARSV